jgi:hypothetical protein
MSRRVATPHDTEVASPQEVTPDEKLVPACGALACPYRAASIARIHGTPPSALSWRGTFANPSPWEVEQRWSCDGGRLLAYDCRHFRMPGSQTFAIPAAYSRQV